MGNSNDDDLLEGFIGRVRETKRGASVRVPRAPKLSVSNHATPRARAAWFNRPRGAPSPKPASPDRPPGQRRVIVKIKPVVHGHVKSAGGAGGMMRHTLYVERDGADRDGDKARVFDRDRDEADGKAFVERSENDRHHFRVILSPEDGAEFSDLKTYTRELMERVERDLKARLDWIAAEHHDTGRPHVHLLIRGRHEDGRDLVIPREYISHSFRQRAEGLATEVLGPRLDRDPAQDRVAQLERMTDLDRALVARADGHELRLADLGEPGPERAAFAQRLNRLEDWGLATRTSPGVWRLDGELETKLARLGEQRDRERAGARLLARENRPYEPGQVRDLEQAHSSQRVTGRLIGWEPIGTQRDGAQLIGVEALDGKIWTARVARPENLRELGGVERGAIIELERGAVSLKPSDRTIWEIARENDGIYSRALHLELRPGDRAPYLDMLERRLEALRREGLVERDRAGNFTLPSNYLDRALAREGQGGRESARVSLIDPHSVENQIRYRGPTWLDRLSDGEADSAQLGRTGFGGKVRDALSQRETALRGIEPDQRRDHLVELEYRDLAARIERQTGKAVIFAQEGDKVQGLYQGRIIMAERSYAMIERDHNVQLAPWRPEMDRARHQQIVGQVRDYQLDFKYGKAAERTLKRGLGLGIDL